MRYLYLIYMGSVIIDFVCKMATARHITAIDYLVNVMAFSLAFWLYRDEVNIKNKEHE